MNKGKQVALVVRAQIRYGVESGWLFYFDGTGIRVMFISPLVRYMDL